jgi:hypothetical protein
MRRRHCVGGSRLGVGWITSEPGFADYPALLAALE